MLGLETALSVVLPRARRASWDADRRADVARARPASPGSPATATTSAPGAPANLTLVDPAARWTVDPAALASRSRNTPYAGMTLPGRVVATFLRGEPTVLDGKAVR